MKKLLALSCLTAVMLAGCGATGDEGSSEQASVTAADTSPTTEVTAEIVSSPEDTTAVEETTTVPDDESAGGVMDMYPSLYQGEVSRVWNETAGENDNMVSADYTLRDLDGNGVPELILRHGTCEADYMINVYTVSDDGELQNIAEIGGSHTAFACEEGSGGFVLLSGHMGIGALRWFEMKNGSVTESRSESFELGKDETYDDIMEKYNVGYIEYVSAFNAGDGETRSTVYYSADDYEEFSGLYLDFIK